MSEKQIPDHSLMTVGELTYHNEVVEYCSKNKITDTLIALVEQGPLWDGDVPSKAERDQLIKDGLASRVIVKGQDGYTAATYRGSAVYKYLLGVSVTIAEAKAFRQTNRAIRTASNQSK